VYLCDGGKGTQRTQLSALILEKEKRFPWSLFAKTVYLEAYPLPDSGSQGFHPKDTSIPWEKTKTTTNAL
jgi:hypothetical protein